MYKVKVLIVRLKSYMGEDTRLEVYPDPLFIVINAETGNEIDNGYRSYNEAKRAYKIARYEVLN